jgi:spore maturation protein CgeB
MRFFEALACRATSLVSPCPEVERLFPDDVAVIYFRSQSELVTKTRELLGDERRRKRLAEEGHRRALAAHTYEHRVRDILQALDIALPGRDGRLVE